MSEKPILFKGDMVRAIMAGQKTQTRRVHATARYAVGDLLWVRERQRVTEKQHTERSDVKGYIRVRYEADGVESELLPYPLRLKGVPEVGKCLSYGGYKESARLWLEVTGVRCERVHKISDADVLAEGLPQRDIDSWKQWLHPNDCAGHAFGVLWDSINAQRGYGWDKNPWVWVYEFERHNP